MSMITPIWDVIIKQIVQENPNITKDELTKKCLEKKESITKEEDSD